MKETEGVIKYQLDFRQQKLDIITSHMHDLNLCRSLLKQNGLVGQDDLRYGGYGFGNISIRNSSHASDFLISGTQTGQLAQLLSSDVASVSAIDTRHNRLCAQGETKPSSEAMSHGVLYQCSELVQAVVHVHSPDIWQRADELLLPFTGSQIPYGTPEMARAVFELAQELIEANAALVSPIVFVMKGHEDGVLVAGQDLASCTELVLDLLTRAKNLQS